MTWREEKQQGSFRQVKFSTHSSGLSGGRRLAIHEYPKRDIPYLEDMGRSRREFHLNCFVIGDDYMAKRDSLIAALEAPGPGTLVHPYYGTRRVAVSRFSTNESTREGGMATFTITFNEGGENQFPTRTTDSQAAVIDTADSTAATVIDELSKNWDVSGPEFVRSSAANLLQDAATAMAALPRPAGVVPAAVSDYLGDLQNLKDSSQQLVLDPVALGQQVTGVIGKVQGLSDVALPSVGMLRGLFHFGDTTVTPSSTTAHRSKEQTNHNLLVGVVERSAVIEAAKVATKIDFASFDEAVAVRDELADELDLMLFDASDDVFAQLQELRSVVIKDITERGADLARVVNYRPVTTLPALVVAHQLYGDSDRADEIIVRNRIPHPGFVQGGQALQVLTDA